MKLVNRAAFVVRFKEPYVQWAAGLDPGDADVADDLRGYVSVFLVPEDPSGREETAPIGDYFSEIFEYELEAWCADDTLWPAERDLDTFFAWFDVVGESMVFDLGAGKLRSVEL